MGLFKNKREKDGEQGRVPVRPKHRTTSHEPPQAYDQSKDLENSLPQGHVASSPVTPNTGRACTKQEENAESSIAQEDQPTIDDRGERKQSSAIYHVPEKAEPAEAYQEPQLPPQKEGDAVNDSHRRREDDMALVVRGNRFLPQDKAVLLDTAQSRSHDTDSGEVRRRRRSHSQSRSDAFDSAQERSPKRSGVRYVIKRTFREENYAPSHKEKATPDRKRQGTESHEQKRMESSAHGQKRPPSEPPSSFPAHSRLAKAQLRPETPQVRSELPLARQESFKSMSERPSRERDPDLTPVQVPPQAIEPIDSHAWERHLPQSADDVTIQHNVLTLFELIEHHVDGYYCDRDTKVSQLPIQLAKLQSSYLPYGIPLEDLLVQARYQGPVIKHCLINLVVAGIAADESPLFSLLPEEFTAIPRAVRKNRGGTPKRPCR
jgi:hypothetical protein